MFKAQFEMDFALITIILIINLFNSLFDFFVFFYGLYHFIRYGENQWD